MMLTHYLVALKKKKNEIAKISNDYKLKLRIDMKIFTRNRPHYSNKRIQKGVSFIDDKKYECGCHFYRILPLCLLSIQPFIFTFSMPSCRLI